MLRRVERQRTPAAPDVDEVGALRECQLATDEVELGALRCGESTGTVAVTVAVAGVRPVAAGVRHRVVEQQLVELVGEVVVVRDRSTVALTGVQRAAEASLRGRRRRPAAERTQANHRGHRADQPPQAGAGRAGSADAAQRVGQIALDVEVAGHVRPGEAELAGLPEKMSERAP